MKYLGSKSKYAEEIIKKHLMNARKTVIDKETGQERLQYYIEPFVGSGAMIQKMGGKRIGNDINPYLIALLKSVQNGWIPPDEISEEEYNRVKQVVKEEDVSPDNYHLFDELDLAYKAFIGFGCSFGAMWFSTYARGKNKYGIPRNYALETKNNLLAQRPYITKVSDWTESVEFTCGEYFNVKIPSDEPCLFYMDSPYKGTTGYRDSIDHDYFYKWILELKNKGHECFISEYDMPSELFTCIWEKEVNVTVSQKNYKKQTEKLFIVKD